MTCAHQTTSERGYEEMITPEEVVKERLDQFHDSWVSEIDDEIGRVRQIHSYIEDDFHIGRCIGEGTFSDVKCIFLKSSHWNSTLGCYAESGQAFALKRLKQNVIADQEMHVIAASDLAMEATILSNLNHENIITLHGVKSGSMTEALANGTYFNMLELLVETLDVRFQKWKVPSTLSNMIALKRKDEHVATRVRDVAIGIAKGLEYLHCRNIIFRDLKPNNIGFDEEDRVKIFDFGLAREFVEGKTVQARPMTGGTGTPRYMAPEVSKMEDSYGYPADVYSFSILLWQIVTKRTPYSRIPSPTELADLVKNKNVRPNLAHVESALLRDLLENGWSADPKARRSFSEIREGLENYVREHGNEKPTRARKQRRLRSMSEPKPSTFKPVTHPKSRSRHFERVSSIRTTDCSDMFSNDTLEGDTSANKGRRYSC
ncbi:protein tyrosine kinase [Fragilaria crotonensis]|nr:protein tyrosine kinase [Fragilaria crotonensis]